MDFLQNIKFVTIPKSLRVVFTIALLSILILNFYIIYVGLKRSDYDPWIAAGGYLLGVVLPIIIILIIIQFSHSGVRALRDRTAEILTGLIPEQLNLTADCAEEFETRSIFGFQKQLRRSATRVEVSFFPDECWADYTLYIPVAVANARRICLVRVRIEINVRRANVDLFVPIVHHKPSGHDRHIRHLHECFPHTINGAERAGYSVNAETVLRNTNRTEYECLVLIREFPDDFLWNSAEKLWFAQDLMFMLRAFVQEQPDMFQKNS